MLDEHDDATIRLVAQGLYTVLGQTAAVAELVRLYGRARAARALQHDLHANCRGHRSTSREVTIDLVGAQPRTIDLRDGRVPSATASPLPVQVRRAAWAYQQRPAAPPAALGSAARTYWL